MPPPKTDDRRARMRMDRAKVKETAEHGAFGSGSSFINVPDNLRWEPPKADTYYFRIVPTKVTLPGNPDKVAVGQYHYRRVYGVHWDVGGSGEAVICPRDTFGKSDVVCSRMQELRSEDYKANEVTIQKYQSKRNCLFALVDVMNNPKKVVVLDWSYSKFARELEKKLRIAKPEHLDFAQIDGGWVLKVMIITGTYLGKPFLKTLEGDKAGGACPGIEFLPGQKFANLSDDLLDQAEKIDLDSYFVITPPEKIAELFAGGSAGGVPPDGGKADVSSEGGFVAEGEAAPAGTTAGDEFGAPADVTAAAEGTTSESAEDGFSTAAADEVAPVFGEAEEAPPPPPPPPAPAKAKPAPKPAPTAKPALAAKPAPAKPAATAAKPVVKPTAPKAGFDSTKW